MQRFILVVAFMAFASPAFAREFVDVPRNHWAYDAVQMVTEPESILQCEAIFHGDRIVNRFQLAKIIQKYLLSKKNKVVFPTYLSLEGKRKVQELNTLMVERFRALARLKSRVRTIEVSVTDRNNANPPGNTP